MNELIFLDPTPAAEWFEKFMAAPVVDVVITIIGVMLGVLFSSRSVRKLVIDMAASFLNYQKGNKEVDQSIQELKNIKEELTQSRAELKFKNEEILSFKKDIKTLKLAFRLLIQNLPDSVGNGAAKQAIDILKEDEENEE